MSTLNSRGKEWKAERVAGDLTALLNSLELSRKTIKKLAYHQTNFEQIFEEALEQAAAIEDIRSMLFDAIKKINAVIESKKNG